MIELSEKWRIHNTDPNNLMLEQLKKIEIKEGKGFAAKSTGEFKHEWQLEGFYSTIQGCLQRYLNVRTSRCKDIEEIQKTLKEVKEFIETSFSIARRA